MSEHQSVFGVRVRRWLPTAPAALLGLAAALMLILIPVVYQDPDATPGSSAIGSLIFAAFNGGLALLAFSGRRNRGRLIAVAVGALLIGLLSLDGVAAFSTHSRAPWIELPLIWAAFVADMLAGVIAIFAAVRVRREATARPTPRGA